ncbi:MAG: endonuclease/exonuclease/phosphatase family protein [Pirellulaceae bacterium]
MPKSSRTGAIQFSRRSFCYLAGSAGGLAVASRLTSAFVQPTKPPLRVIAYNVYECTGWPKDNLLAQNATKMGQMPARFALELGLYEPDIVNLSESPKESVVKEIAERLGMNYVYFPSGQKWPGTIMSRFKIVGSQNCPVVGGQRSQELFTRHWGMAEIQLPEGTSLVVHSAHLHPSNSQIRQQEIAEMLRSMEKDFRDNRSMLLIGDLNHTPQEEEYALWKQGGWIDTFAQVGQGDGLTFKADVLERRIDYVWAAGPIAQQVVESKTLLQGAFRTNPADPHSFSLSDHLPHMAVFAWD